MKNYFFGFFMYLLIGCNSIQNQNLKLKEKILNFEDKLILLVLEENNINQEYTLKIEADEIIEYSITYLGNIVNNKNDTLRFINFVRYSGYVIKKELDEEMVVF